MHVETGFWRFPAPDRVELVVAHPTGITELSEGTLTRDDDGTITISIATTSVGVTATAKSVTALERTFRLLGDELTYSLEMAAVGLPLTHHLSATLRRTR
jgi:hypothetical protein